jgi:hypothetical protein
MRMVMPVGVVDVAIIRHGDGRRGQRGHTKERGGEKDFQHLVGTFSASRVNAPFPIIRHCRGAKEFTPAPAAFDKGHLAQMRAKWQKSGKIDQET